MYFFTSKLHTYNIAATDGEMGKVKDIYIDDRTWNIRYAIVDNRKWLPERKVLLSPSSFIQINEEEETLEVDYDKQMIKHSPSVPEESDLTRDKENQLIKYFGWTRYWPDDVLISGDQRPIGVFHDDQNERIHQSPEDYEREQLIENHRDNNGLRSHEEIIGARVHAKDGKLGVLIDFIYDRNWKIGHIVIQNKGMGRDEYYFYPVDQIVSVDWYEKDIYINETVTDYGNKITFDNKQDILKVL